METLVLLTARTNRLIRHLPKLTLAVLLLFTIPYSFGQKTEAKLAFTVTMEDPASQLYHVIFRCEGLKGETLNFKMPVWTPGYYQLMNYAKSVENFRATDGSGNALKWEKTANSRWTVHPRQAGTVTLTYDIRATRNFVAGNFLDESHGYISPAGVFLHPEGQLKHPVTVTLKPYTKWPQLIATGLDSVGGQPQTYVAPNYDILYDSPMLMGKLEQLPSFEVNGIPHHFIGYNLGPFDRAQFIADLKKIVAGSAAVIGDIPYKHYTFIAIGPGGGGIEHLNSTSISFSGEQLNTRAGRNRMYNFLAHEYFHHYNVKRIRPVELGPFNYDQENRTRMLWVSEGFTVYYPYLILKKAGLMTEEEVFSGLQSNIASYENKPGHRFQSATQASFETWEDGPFGRTGDEAYKTISYYSKGPVLGAMLDFKIRHESQNKKSLDDVMRALYRTYYQKQQRGFTEKEFWAECEKAAGTKLTELADYAATTKEIDYPNYFAYAGLAIDTTSSELPGVWLGISFREKGDSLLVTETEWQSPAWNAGLRNGAVILAIDGQKATVDALSAISKNKKLGDSVRLLVWQNGQQKETTAVVRKKSERNFRISRLPNPNPLQSAILKSWL
ncbi:M61 family metallopeptidase [Larkinella insperata]|uniref:M61 family metallopeptidase n=1 Tax=Larkinella insperata TaxID=332158 RepID=A0ABW3Q4H3_9BACT|nr:PDZ domain-containing protein [Larkinella insperata]